MTEHSAPTPPAKRIRVSGATVAAAILAHRLSAAGQPVMRDESSEIDQSLLRLARRASVAALSTTGFETIGIRRLIHRTLTEIDFSDSSGNDVPTVAVRTGRAALAPSIDEVRATPFVELRVETDVPSSGDLRPVFNELDLTLEIQWDSSGGDAPLACELSGEHLQEMSASATIVSVPGLTSLLLTVPMSILVAQSIAIADIAYRLLQHPGIHASVPGTSFDRATSFMTFRSPVEPTEQYSTKSLRIGAAAGFAEPVWLDREIASAVRAADVLVQAFKNQRWSGAYLARLTRRSA